MKYYKIIIGNNFIGVINSTNFFKENINRKKLTMADEILGQFVEYNGILYRDYWMKAIPNNTRVFQQATISEISEEEYTTFLESIHKHEAIVIEDDEEEQPTINPIPQEDPDVALEFIRQAKISEMSYQCRKTIEAGVDVQLRMETKHFSMDTQDQLNLMSLGVMAQTQQLIPYHADGETCIFYTADEINKIVAAATAHKVYHTTYYNALKNYINSLSTIEEIAAITYGTPIPEEYQSEVLKVITQ